MTEAQLEHLRAAATDCARAADDYDAEGLHGIADRFREHAAHLWLIAGATDCPPATHPSTSPNGNHAPKRISSL